jgi:hypothetical protein
MGSLETQTSESARAALGQRLGEQFVDAPDLHNKFVAFIGWVAKSVAGYILVSLFSTLAWVALMPIFIGGLSGRSLVDSADAGMRNVASVLALVLPEPVAKLVWVAFLMLFMWLIGAALGKIIRFVAPPVCARVAPRRWNIARAWWRSAVSRKARDGGELVIALVTFCFMFAFVLWAFDVDFSPTSHPWLSAIVGLIVGGVVLTQISIILRAVYDLLFMWMRLGEEKALALLRGDLMTAQAIWNREDQDFNEWLKSVGLPPLPPRATIS